MYWVECKQSNSHTSLTTLCSHFHLLTVIRPWLNLPTGGHGQVICMGNLGGVFSCENTPEGRKETHKISFFPYKQVGEMVIMNDLEWSMLSYYVIYYEKFKKSHAANREGSFKFSRFCRGESGFIVAYTWSSKLPEILSNMCWIHYTVCLWATECNCAYVISVPSKNQVLPNVQHVSGITNHRQTDANNNHI